MKYRYAVGAFAAAALVTAGILTVGTLSQAGEGLKSGLQKGESPTPFHPLNLTGDQAGKKQCLV